MYARRMVRATRTAAIIAVAIGWLVAAGGAGAATKTSTLNARAAAQIAALQRIKTSLSPAERKLDSRLAVGLRERRAPSARRALPMVHTGVKAAGLTEVDIRVTAVTANLLKRLGAAGAQVRHASPAVRSIRAGVPASALTRVAGWSDVQRIEPAVGFITSHVTRRGSAPRTEAKRARAARVRAALAAAAAAPSQGPVVSEGDKAEAADVARATSHVTGIGVKVCALSDGVDSLAAEESAGELPANVDVVPGEGGSGDEGTAILEVVHDLAPNASLGFATATTSDASFADNIRTLRFQHHCDILVDDILYLDEDPFQDGPIAQAVNAVTDDGALYFSAAGNWGNTLDHTSGNYEGDFVSSGRHIAKLAGFAHDFDPGAGVQIYDPLSDYSAGAPVTLWWADPLGHAADDYDLYELDRAGNVLAFSQNVQNGNDDPRELLVAQPGDGIRLAVVRYAGATRYFQLTALGGRFERSADGLPARVTPGAVRGHEEAVDAFSVAAAPAAGPLPFDLQPGDPANPHGPFPGPFTAAQRPERFTSDGPRRVFFNPDGAPITPGNFTHTGGTVRRKPDITAADGVSTGLANFSPFFGTSAAVPHAAAMAALVLSGNPDAGTADLRSAFTATALDLAPAGFDNRSGQGLVRADRLLAYTGATPQPLVNAGTPRVVAATGDGDPYLEPGETANLVLPVTNVGDGTATGVNVTVTSDDPTVTVTPHARSYGTLASRATTSRTYGLALAANRPNGKPVHLALKVGFAGRLSPTTSTATVTTGRPAATVTTFAYAGAPVAIPDFSDLGATVPIRVTGIGYASQVTFEIDGRTCTTAEGATTVGIAHTYVGDLLGTLTGPGGQTVRLFTPNPEDDGNNMCKVVFADNAARPFSDATAADAPFTGSWRPTDPLATLLSSPVTGTWRFKVADTAALDTGTIRAVSLHIRGVAPT